jgi:hypothetical protein
MVTRSRRRSRHTRWANATPNTRPTRGCCTRIATTPVNNRPLGVPLDNWPEASGDAARCPDRNLDTYPVARCPGPPRDQRALLLGTERRRTRRGPGHSTHRLGRCGTHSPEATNADRSSDGPDQQQSFEHVKPCLLSFTSRAAAPVAGATPMAVAATTRSRIIWHPDFDLDGEAVRPRDGSAYITKSARERAKWNQVFPHVLFAGQGSSIGRVTLVGHESRMDL